MESCESQMHLFKFDVLFINFLVYHMFKVNFARNSFTYFVIQKRVMQHYMQLEMRELKNCWNLMMVWGIAWKSWDLYNRGNFKMRQWRLSGLIWLIFLLWIVSRRNSIDIEAFLLIKNIEKKNDQFVMCIYFLQYKILSQVSFTRE